MGLELEVQNQEFDLYSVEINGNSVNFNVNETTLKMDSDGDFMVKLSIDADDLLSDAEMESNILDELKRNGYTIIDSDGDEV